MFRPEREAQVINGLQTANPGPLKASNVATIWREIMSACRALEAPQRVAYLGPAGHLQRTGSGAVFWLEHRACALRQYRRGVPRHHRGHGRNLAWCRSRTTPKAWSPRSLDLFLNSPLHVVGETSLLVRHNLLRLGNSLDGIEVVIAHPQALAQCQGWLTAHLPRAERRAASSNAEGRAPGGHQRCVGPVSPASGQRPNSALHVVQPAIQDDAFNRTRFAVVCLPQTLAAPEASGKDCVSLIVSVPNKPGAVHDLLVPLKQHGVSMTRFESRPARSGQWEYFFYIDIQGHPSQPNVAAALADLRGLCAFYKVLGTYPIGE